MANVAGVLEIQLRADIARLQRDMDQVKGVVFSATKNIESSVGMARSALASLGVAVGGAAFVHFTKSAIDAADKLNDLTQSLGVNIAALAQYELATAQGGASLEALGKGIKGMSTAFAENGDALRKAGVDAATQDGRLRQLADIFAAMPDGIEKTTLAVKMFGKSGMELIPMLNGGSAALDVAAEKSAKYAAMMAVMAPRADAFNDSMAELAVASKAASYALVNDALPALTKISGAMAVAAHESGVLQAAWVGLGGFGWEFIFKPFRVLLLGITIDLDELNVKLLRFFRQEKAALEVEASIAGMYKRMAALVADDGGVAAKAAPKFDTAAWTKQYKELMDALGAGKKANKAATDENAQYNTKMRDLDTKGWIAKIEADIKEYEDGLAAQRKIDEDATKERLRLEAEANAERERLRQADLAGWIAYVDALSTEYEAGLLAIHSATKSNIQISDEAKKALGEYLDPAKAKSFGDALSAAFGSAGSALSKLINALDDYGQKMAEIEKMRATNAKINDPVVRAANEIKLAEQSANAQIAAYGDMAAAAKGFFDTGSTGYKALEAAEKVFRAFELASAIQTMLTKSGLLATFTGLFVASKATETAATVASVGPDVAASMIKGQAAAVAGVANQAQGDPYSAWVRMAAMAAVMAGLGFAVSGSFNSGGGGMTAAERQKQQGTGTVLGDAEAKSNSLLNAIEEIEKTDKLGLILSHQMLDSLRAIQSAMGALASLIYRTTGLTSGAGMNIEGLGTQNTARPGVGGLDSLNQRIADALGFGSLVSGILGLWGKTTKEITDAGLFMFGRLGELMAGQNMRAWANVKTTETSWFGLSKDESNSSEFADLDPAVVRQFQLIFGGIADAVETAAKALDVWTPYFREAMLNIALDIGAISLKDLKGQELQDALNAIFSNAADTVAQTMIPGFEEFQRVGEGYFETLMRVATANEYVKNTFEALGISIPFVGMQAITARMGLVDLAGGLEEFGKLTQDYYSQYYSPAEQRAQTGSALGAEFGALGINMPTSTAGFRALVDGIDWAKEGANELFISLMRLAPTFFDYTTSVIGLDGALHSLDDVTQQHTSLQEELDVLTGSKTAQFVERSNRMAEAIDATSQATLTAIFAEEDRQAGLEKQAAQNQARWDLEQELLDLTQTESEALARHRDLRITELALRETELNLAAGTLTSIQLEIDAQQDLNAERIAGAEAAKKTSDLEGRLGVLRGEYSQKELDRAREWQAAASDTDRVLLTQIYTQEDLAAAAKAATDAEAERADMMRTWQEKLDILTGARTRTEIDRENFLNSTTDEATKAIMRAVFAQEDLKAAADEATAAVASLSAGVQPLNTVWVDFGNGFGYWMAVVAESTDAATAAANIAKQRRDLEIQLMEALGDAEGALAARRADILAGLDESLRGLQQQVWDALDAQKLREAAKAWTDTLDAWLDANSLDASLSPLTAQQALMEAQRQYDIAKAGGDAGALTAAADALLAADKAVEGFGGGYSALYAQIRADIGGLSASGPVATVGEAAIVNGISDLRKEVADAKAETARLLERLIEATRDQTDDVSGAVKDGTKKTTAAATAAVAVNARR